MLTVFLKIYPKKIISTVKIIIQKDIPTALLHFVNN